MNLFKVGRLKKKSSKLGDATPSDPLTDSTNFDCGWSRRKNQIDGKLKVRERSVITKNGHSSPLLFFGQRNRLQSFQSKMNKAKEKIMGGPKGQSPQSLNSWKSGIDEKTKKRYYYNKNSKVVTWVKPKNYNEWRVYFDRVTNKFYYHNTFTKETTWTKPPNFIHDYSDEVINRYLNQDENTSLIMSKYQNYEVNDSLTEKEVVIKRQNSSGTMEELIPKQDERTSKHLHKGRIHSDPWKAYFDYTSGQHFFYNFNTKKRTWAKPKGFQEWITVESSSSNELYYYNILTGVSSWNKPSFDNTLCPTHLSSTNKSSKDELHNLTLKYCPHDIKYTERLMRKFKGYEQVPLHAIQSFEKFNAPFDENNVAVVSYVRAAVTPVGSEPYDEMGDTHIGNDTLPTCSDEVSRKIQTSTTSSFSNCESSIHSGILTYPSRNLAKAVHFVGPNGRTAMYMYR